MESGKSVTEHEYSKESRWATVVLAVVGALVGLVNGVREPSFASFLLGVGFAIAAVVGWRHPIAYDRPVQFGPSQFLRMPVRDRVLSIVVALCFATSLMLFIRNDL